MADTENTEVEFDEDLFDSMVYGSYEEPEQIDEDSVDEEDTTDAVGDLDDNDEHQEDTDQKDEPEDDDDLYDNLDGDDDEDLESEEDAEEEDSLVEDDSSNDEDDDTEGEEKEADEADDLGTDEDFDEESEDETDTEGISDGESPDTDGIDYKAFYDKVVNTEFKVNGKLVKGFADPDKIIQSQQMAGGFSEKMAGFKQYRPFMAPLKDRGMLEDQAKFDLAMNLVDGDKEAIKKHLQSLNIDPLDLDMEKIEYSAQSAVTSPSELVIEDTLDRARSVGIEDKVRQVIGKDWDAESFKEFVSNEAVRNDLLTHMETGAYDKVQDKILEMSRLDYSGQFNSMPTIGRYRAAVQALQQEAANAPVKQESNTKAPQKDGDDVSVKAQKARIIKARKEEEYKEKAAKQSAKVAKQRKRATSMSKKKPKAKVVVKKKFDPLELEGDEFDQHMEFLMSGGRG